jgi:hypothetical protein
MAKAKRILLDFVLVLLQGNANQLASGPDTGFRKELLQGCLDRAFRYADLFGNFLVPQTIEHTRENQALALAESFSGGDCGGLAPPTSSCRSSWSNQTLPAITSRIPSASNAAELFFVKIPETPLRIRAVASLLSTPAVTTSTLPV